MKAKTLGDKAGCCVTCRFIAKLVVVVDGCFTGLVLAEIRAIVDFIDLALRQAVVRKQDVILVSELELLGIFDN